MGTSSDRGVSLVETIVVIAVVSVLFAMAFGAFNTLNSGKALETDALRVALELQEARSLTVSSKDAQQYGVHFASSSVTRFEGASFVAGSPANVTTALNQAVIVSSTTLSGGSVDVVFKRLSGETAQSGTVVLSLAASSTILKTIMIYKTGVAEVQ